MRSEHFHIGKEWNCEDSLGRVPTKPKGNVRDAMRLVCRFHLLSEFHLRVYMPM